MTSARTILASLSTPVGGVVASRAQVSHSKLVKAKGLKKACPLPGLVLDTH